MVTTVTYPVAPTTTPLKGTLLDAATVVDNFEWQTEIGLFDSFNCMKFREAAAFCGPNSKDLDQVAEWIDGFKFSAYGGLVCKGIGLDDAHMLAEATRAFEQGESAAVEAALMANRFVDSADGPDAGTDPDLWVKPEDITPAGGAVSVKAGIALLEGFASGNYIGVPTLHVPVAVASLLLNDNGLDFQGNLLRTKWGSKVAAGAGYDFPNTDPDGADAAAGEKWLYATGEVIVIRGKTFIRQEMDRSTNEVFVLAERPYIAAVDCFTAAIKVTVE